MPIADVSVEIRVVHGDESVSLTCPNARDGDCRRVRDDAAPGEVVDVVPRAVIAPLLDELWDMPLMRATRATGQGGGDWIWQIRLGLERNRVGRLTDWEVSSVEATWRVLWADVPARPAHGPATIDVTQAGGDPAYRVIEAHVRCRRDALWCERAQGGLPWWAVAVLADDARLASVWTGDATPRSPDEPNANHWRWHLDFDGRTNVSGPVTDLSGDAFHVLVSLLEPTR